MDPIGLTASIIELALKVKDSIDTFAKHRNHAKELASDVVVDLRRIAEFYAKNESMLSHEALGPLRESLGALRSDLFHFYERCLVAYRPKQECTKARRLALAIKLWADSNEIEAGLVRIKERIQSSMNCILLLSGARVEVRVTKIEGLLANAYGSRDCIRQFDSAFMQELLNGDPGLRTFDRPPSELDDVDVQYVRMKAMKLVDTISVATITTAVKKTFYSRIYTSTSPKPVLHNIIFTTGKLQAQASGECITIIDLCRNASYLVEVLDQLGAMDIIRRILDTLENRLRQILRLGTRRLRVPYHVREEEEDALDQLELILHYQNYYRLGHSCEASPAYSICDEDIKGASDFIQFSRSRLMRMVSPSTDHRMRFVRSLMSSISYHSTRGQIEECFGYCSEALEAIQPCITSTARENSNIITAGALQLHLGVFDYLSLAQVRACDYTSAYHTGMECMASFKALSNFDKSILPDNFDYCPEIMEHMQREMPTWTSVVRNPEHRGSYLQDYIDEDNAADDTTRRFEWGIAI